MPSTTDQLFALQITLLLDLLKADDSTAVRLLRLYAATFERLNADWLALLNEIEAQRAGQASFQPLDFVVFQADRIRSLRAQTLAQIGRFAAESEREVGANQRLAVRLSQQHASVLVAESLKASAPGVALRFSPLPTRALEELVGRFSDGEPLRALFDQLGPDAAAKAEATLFKALATGTNPTLAARQLRTELGVPLTRATAISRTEMLGAYRSGTLQSYRENSDVVKAWRWNAHLGPRTCAACIALNGSIWPLSVQFFPGHVCCRCSPSPVTVTLADLGLRTRFNLPQPELGSDWFADQDEATQLRVLGLSKLALYQSGKIDLTDLVHADFSPRWGPSYREASISQALANHGSERFRFKE